MRGATAPATRRVALLRTALGVLLLLPTGAFAAARVDDRRTELADLETRVLALPRDSEGQFLPPNFRGDAAGFPAFVRRLVPVDASYRLQQGPLAPALRKRAVKPVLETSACGRLRLGPLTGPDYAWLTYQLIPRRSTCDRSVRWFVFLGLEPLGLPADAIVHRYATDLVVAELPSGGPLVRP